MEALTQTVQWWHWVVLGIVLVAAEIVIPSFIVIWFGVAALAVGATVYLFAPAFDIQLYLWSGLSVLLLLAYWKYFKKAEPEVPVGQSEGEYAGIEGKVLEVLGEGRYRARFELPVLGDRVWIVETENGESLEEGDPILVSHVYGQILKVKKAQGA
jgi:membrane protein implicated in regulation of membrane protease activity